MYLCMYALDSLIVHVYACVCMYVHTVMYMYARFAVHIIMYRFIVLY